jgi:hypothetical protein
VQGEQEIVGDPENAISGKGNGCHRCGHQKEANRGLDPSRGPAEGKFAFAARFEDGQSLSQTAKALGWSVYDYAITPSTAWAPLRDGPAVPAK